MARNRVSLQVKGFDEYMAKLDEIGDSQAMRRGVNEALKVSKEYVTPLIESAMATANLPAGGKYSTGRTKDSIDKDMTVNWSGFTAEIKVGFDWSKSGVVSQVLIYGSPKQAPVKGLYEAIYGNKSQREIGKLQGKALDEVIKSIMEGK